MCLDLLRRLSKSQNTVFCGRIQLFLARLFPLSEKSGKKWWCYSVTCWFFIFFSVLLLKLYISKLFLHHTEWLLIIGSIFFFFPFLEIWYAVTFHLYWHFCLFQVSICRASLTWTISQFSTRMSRRAVLARRSVESNLSETVKWSRVVNLWFHGCSTQKRRRMEWRWRREKWERKMRLPLGKL